LVSCVLKYSNSYHPSRLDRAHKEVLFFASPFFEAALSGNWSETGRPPSMSSVITISQPPSIPGGDRNRNEVPTEMTFAPMDPDVDVEELEMIAECDAVKVDSASEGEDEQDSDCAQPDAIARARDSSLAKLQGVSAEGSTRQSRRSSIESAKAVEKRISPTIRRRLMNGPDAVIVLKEERVSQSYILPYLQDTYLQARRVRSMIFSNLYTLSKSQS
jgi:hypothetical protein